MPTTIFFSLSLNPFLSFQPPGQARQGEEEADAQGEEVHQVRVGGVRRTGGGRVQVGKKPNQCRQRVHLVTGLSWRQKQVLKYSEDKKKNLQSNPDLDTTTSPSLITTSGVAVGVALVTYRYWLGQDVQ